MTTRSIVTDTASQFVKLFCFNIMKSFRSCRWLLTVVLIISATKIDIVEVHANKDGLSSSSRKGVAVVPPMDSRAHKRIEQPENLDESEDRNGGEESISTSSIAISGGLSIVQNVLSNSAGPILRSSARIAQLALCCYMTKASWSVIKEVWEELSEEFTSLSGGKEGLDVREEQDMPYADEDVLDHNQDNSDGNDSNATPKSAATRELAARLRSAGILYASEAPSEETRTVESVMKSLSRSEGNILSQTLLSPSDGGHVNGGRQQSTDAAAAEATQAWNNIGGLADAKESLLDLAFPLLTTTHNHVRDSENNNNNYGGLLANPPGVLLYGPPGCGKSMLVRALAATVGARFLVVSPSCLLRKYVGETNLNVRALFSVARKISPCVLFVDELDGLFRERGGEDHDVGRDLKTEFLQLWDGIRHHQQSTDETSSILVIGATNRPFDIDPAFLRRMPRRIFVGLPDEDARTQILRNMLRQVPLDPAFDIGSMARSTSGYSPSDIREVLQAAALYPLREARAKMMKREPVDAKEIPKLRSLTNEDVWRALAIAKPTHFSRKYQRQLMQYLQTSGGNHHSPHSGNFGAQSGNHFFGDANSFNNNYNGNEDYSDDFSTYDGDSSDSEYDL